MNKQIIRNENVGEEYIVATHKSGLKIYICEKKDYSKTYAIFGTKYGSVDNCFKTAKDSEYTCVPEGIAHFLEHKLFESEEGDAFSRFSATGASANAYTSFDKTCYLFTCADNFYDSFEILLDFVQHPFFTEETVRKEQGIIGQEISMYDDSPGWVLLFNLLNVLYHNNPVRINIAGTKDTIAKIDANLLYKCYETFYNLNNMFIVVSGNADADKVLEMCDKFLADKEGIPVESKDFDEPKDIVKDFISQKMPVAQPLFAFGIKQDVKDTSVKRRVETEMLLEILSGHQSSLYNRMVSEGICNRDFSSEYFEGRGFASVLFSGESKDPEKVATEIKNEITRLINDGINEEDFESVRRQFLGHYIMDFEDVETVGDSLVTCACNGEGLFDEGDILKNVTREDLAARLKTDFNLKYSALSVIDNK